MPEKALNDPHFYDNVRIFIQTDSVAVPTLVVLGDQIEAWEVKSKDVVWTS